MQTHHIKTFLRRKPVKIVSIVLLCLLLLFVIALSAISIYVQSHKKDIIARVKTEFAHRVNGELTIGDIDLSVWTNFPNIAIKIKNISVADSLYHLPLLKANEISCAVNIFQLTSSTPDISRVTATGGLFHLFIDSAGYNNDYLLKPKNRDSLKAAGIPSAKPIVIHDIALKDFQFISEDKVKNKRYGVSILSADAQIERKDSLLLIDFTEDCKLEGLGFRLDKGMYLGNSTIKGRWKMQFDKSAKVLTASKSDVNISGNDFTINAAFHFGKDTSYFMVHAHTTSILFRDARAILTQKIQSKLKFIDVATPLEVDANLTGPLAHGGDPFVLVTIKAKNSILQTPIASFTDCNFTGVYDNRIDSSKEPGDPNSIIYFPQFTGKWFNVPLGADSIRIDNLETPTMVFNFKANCSFAQLDDALNLQSINFDEGSAKLDLHYYGPLTTDPNMLANITGGLTVQNGKLTYVPHNLQFINCNGALEFGKNAININNITCDYKGNHFVITGQGNSINHAMMADSGKSNVICNIFCPQFNANDFKAVFAKTGGRAKPTNKKGLGATVAGIDNILQKGDIALNITAKEFLLDKFVGQNARVNLLLQQNDWLIQRAALNFGGGSFMLSARLHRQSSSFAANAHIAIKNADVRKAFYAFNNFGQDGILYSNLRGMLNNDADINLQLDDKGGIQPGSLGGTVNFSILNGALINYAPVMSIQQYAFKNRDLSNIEFAELKNTLTVKQNQVIIPRMEIASTAMRIFVEGAYGVMGSPTDISIQVPLSNLSKPEEGAKARNKGLNAKVGSSVYLRAKSRPDGKVKIGLDLFRKFRKSGVDTTGGK